MKAIEKPVTFTRDHLQLIGMLHLPQNEKKIHSGIMMLHGFTGHKAESHFLFTKMAREFAHAGFACLRFDFAGSGDSEGDFKNMTILSELEDAKAALNFFMDQPEINMNRIGVLGLSLGGCVAAILAGETPGIRSLILISAVARPYEQFQKHAAGLKLPADENSDWFVDRGGFEVGADFFKTLPAINPLKSIQKYFGPTLIIHGTNDDSVPMSAAHDYFNILQQHESAITELYEIENADHVFSSVKFTVELIEKTMQWFKETLHD